MISEETLRVYNKTLEPNLWDKDQNLNSDIRLYLLKIANDFYKSTDFKSEIIDILMLGSTINYNWTPNSDIDLHIVIDIKKEGLDPDHFRKFLDSVAGNYNKEHDIEIRNHPVELYLQDISEKNSTPEKLRAHASMFSLLKNKWIVPPKYEKPSLDKEIIKKKFYELKSEIDKIIKEKNIDGLKDLMKTIKDYRNKGLEGDKGEFSTENIVFKALRHTGILEKLKDSINSIYDKSVSINEKLEYYKNIIVPDNDLMDSIIQETIEYLEEKDKPYILIGAVDDNLSVVIIKQEKSENNIGKVGSYGTDQQFKSHAMLYYGDHNIDPCSSIHWRYRSDINEIFWWAYPSEKQSISVKEFLFEKYKVSSPRMVYLGNTNVKYRRMFHDLEYKYKQTPELQESLLDKKSNFYLGWVKRNNLKVAGTDIHPETNDDETHYNYLMGMPPEWKGDSDSNLIRWRYRRDKNIVYWWSFSNPTDEEKEAVEYWLRNNLGVITHDHRIMYVPILDPEDNDNRNREDAHGWG